MAKSAGKKATGPKGRSGRKKQAEEAVRQTKKQIAMGRKQARQNRIIWMSVGALALLIVAILVVGLVSELILKPAEAVATVNDGAVRTDDYEAYLRYQRYNLHSNISDLENGLQSLDPDVEGNDFLISFYQQQLTQLQTMLMTAPESSLDDLIDYELIRQHAGELDAEISTAEIEQSIREDLGRAVAPPAQEPISDTQQLPTPTPVSQEALDDYLKSVLENLGLSEKEFQTVVGYSLLASKAQETLAGQVATTGLVADVQLVKTEDEGEANAALDRIVGGEDLAVVAKEVSTEPDAEETGGSLGWVAPSQFGSKYGEAASDAAFTSQIGEPVVVESNGAWYVVLVVARDDDGPLPEEVLSELQNSALTNWLEQVKADPGTQIERPIDYAQVPPDPFGALNLP